MTTLFHDYETYSDLDIRKVGAEVYARHPSTEILMMSWAIDNEPVQLWVPAESEKIPDRLLQALQEPNILLSAFNAPFEAAITRHVMKFGIPISRYRCTMAESYALSFSGGLADVGAQVGLPHDKQKLATGKKLIDRFCKPAPSNHKADRYDRFTHPDEWEQFKQYCIQDTETERALHQWLDAYGAMDGEEWRVWELSEKINQRGMPVDKSLAAHAVRLHKEAKGKLLEHMKWLTGLDNPASNTQLLPWINERLPKNPMPDMQADTITAWLKFDWLPETVRLVLEDKRRIAMTAPTKWKAYLDRTGDDGLLRGMFQYGGASRTRRWSSKGVQLQNLKSPNF